MFGDAMTNAVLAIAVVMVGTWIVSVALKNASIVDIVWGAGFVVVAWVMQLTIDGDSTRQWIVTSLVTIWGVRLAVHLITRWRREGEDPRYKKIMGHAMETKGWSWAKTALLMVFLTQAPLLFITSLPAQLGIWASEGGRWVMGPIAWAGVVIAMIGIIFETVGDAQLKAFRSNPANKGKVLDTGLWRYTRHPNYFGDACTWWGIWLVAAETGPAGWVSIIGPIFLTFTLTKWSGKPLLERSLKKNRPDYAAYIERTSGFFPWPPKK